MTGAAGEHETLRTRTAAWVQTALAAHADAWEARGEFPREVFAEAGRAGVFGWKVPPEYGGTGPDLRADAVVTSELASCGSGGVAAALGAHKDLGSYYVLRFGTETQRAQWVPACARGEAVTAFAVTEPGAGSDVASIRTRAVRQRGGDWTLEGEKTFITNGTSADLLVVAAVTDPDAGGHHGMTLFLVERDDPGFTSTRIPTLGWRTSQTAALSFTAVRLPAERVLGGEDGVGRAFTAIMRNFQWERLVMALAAVRGSHEALATGVARAQDSVSQWRFGNLAAEAFAAEALTDHALALHVAGRDAVREVSMAKWYACDVAVRAAALALAHAESEPDRARADRRLRDARLGPIGGGTTEIMLEVIGRSYEL